MYVEARSNAIVTNNNEERTSSCVALGPPGNRQGLVKCLDIETDKVLIRWTVTQVPWPLDGYLLQKVEEWGRKGVRAIKKNRIDFLNRKGEKFDWDSDNISELEVVEDQPKLVDLGVALKEVNPDEYDQDLGIKQKEEKTKPLYAAKAITARQNAGLGVELVPRQARGVDGSAASEIIEIDDDGSEELAVSMRSPVRVKDDHM